jgi:hypothetical protein
VSASNDLSGSTGNDILLATIVSPSDSGSSELFGGEGDDQLTVFGGDGNLLDGGPGRDIVRGGSGADTLVIDANDLIGPGTTISGGPSTSLALDTLVFDFDLDLTAIANERIANIERMDLTSGNSNSLTMNLGDVLAATDADDTLIVEGDGSDSVNLVGAWTVAEVPDDFTDYVLGGARVSIDSDIDVAIA